MLFFSLPIFAVAAPPVDLCLMYGGIYATTIEPKITSGIPFELMALVAQNESVLCKRVIHITYNLWDEIVSIEDGEKLLHKIPLKKAGEQICRDLSCSFVAEKANKQEKIVYKLLLNPMWPGRIARLKASLPEQGGSHSLLNIDWAEIVKEMPSEKELLTKEIMP
jgi:predicted transcriptional regulator